MNDIKWHQMYVLLHLVPFLPHCLKYVLKILTDALSTTNDQNSQIDEPVLQWSHLNLLNNCIDKCMSFCNVQSAIVYNLFSLRVKERTQSLTLIATLVFLFQNIISNVPVIKPKFVVMITILCPFEPHALGRNTCYPWSKNLCYTNLSNKLNKHSYVSVGRSEKRRS